KLEDQTPGPPSSASTSRPESSESTQPSTWREMPTAFSVAFSRKVVPGSSISGSPGNAVTSRTSRLSPTMARISAVLCLLRVAIIRRGGCCMAVATPGKSYSPSFLNHPFHGVAHEHVASRFLSRIRHRRRRRPPISRLRQHPRWLVHRYQSHP